MANLQERLQAFNAGLLPDILKLKYEAMAENPFRFYRGTCHLFYEDVAAAAPLPLSPLAWICGDLHIENFGSYRGDNKLVYFDLNDFDEALLAPAAWELARMVTSIFIAFETLNIEPEKARNMVALYLKSYATTLAVGKARCIEPRTAKGIVCDFLEAVKQRSYKELLKKRTVSKKRRIMLSLEDERHFKVDKKLKAELIAHLQEWLKTSRDAPYNYHAESVVFRLAGTGSLGLRRYLFLLKSKSVDDHYLLIDMKECRPSSVRPHIPVQQLQWADEAARVTGIQKRMQYTSASLLSTTSFRDRSYMIQELQPVKDTLKFKLLKKSYRNLYRVIEDMGMLTASAQLRSGGIQGSSNIDDLIAFGCDDGWQQALTGYAFDAAVTFGQYYREFCEIKHTMI
ncbi:DUF2252 domain-containing protein [Mucilaginibacter gynuensis]|uniref:DUF2252 domain-containing protein n=1 Tax=Mucilaginibacter gynuensis TaxID=1302236 RepID=A0ABP8GD93_9SPHI